MRRFQRTPVGPDRRADAAWTTIATVETTGSAPGKAKNPPKSQKYAYFPLEQRQGCSTFHIAEGTSRQKRPSTNSREFMATKKAATKTSTKKAVKKAAAPKAAAAPQKPIKEALSKSGLVAHLAETSGVVARDVRSVLSALEGAVAASVNKKGAGSFTLPGLLKISAIKVDAKPKRKGINPFTKEEQWFAAKPATVKVKVRPLKKLKDAAA
jgi:nucleoid DNA-binding protein